MFAWARLTAILVALAPLAAAQETLVPEGADWKYLDDGSDQGTAWRETGFDDSAWASGPAELGYGDGDEATVVDYGPSAAAKYATTYFRHTFSVADPAAHASLTVRLIRDDGAVVYLNGTEVFRSNMPAGAVTYNTFASGTTGGTEDEFQTATVDASLLQAGDNVVAVEVHQASGTSSDMSFDFELTAAAPPPDPGTPPGPTTPGPGDPLIASGATWLYLDDGSDQGTAWRDVDFDDGAWAWGPAQLGYGDGDEATVVDYGPSPSSKYTTTYFRHAFSLSDPSALTGLKVRLLRDDGAVVYLNGTEVFRSNMPAGTIDSDTFSAGGAGGTEDEFLEATIDASLLRTGTNVVAVEVHQSSGTSSDLSFDLELTGDTTEPPPDPGTPPGPTTPGPGDPLIASGATWMYLDDGSDQGTAWRETGFDDGAWLWGPAQLGYGDGDESTVVDYGPSPSSKYTTTYFRHAFLLTDASAYTGLKVRLLRDDGAVVYLNGTEVFRSNMPTGAVDFETFANGAGGTEDEFQEKTLDASLLQDGVNVVAVEVHQSSGGSSDLSFDLELLEDAVAPPPDPGSGPGPTTPGPGDPLIAAGATWRYLDDGSDQGTAWRDVGFDDGAWAWGPAELGYGDGDEATVVGFGPSAGSKYPTTYFRHAFSLTDPAAYAGLRIRLLRDDGAVVYLNGTEVFRSNMPTGAIDYLTPAADGAGGTEDEFQDATLDASLLQEGVNVVAVEVHQSSGTSSDMSFNLELLDAPAPPDPSAPPVPTTPGPHEPLITAGATWMYLDDGSDQGTAWRDVDFDDGAWAWGPAQLGYGDGDEATVVGFGPSSGSKYTTTYFRHAFSLADPSLYPALKLRLLRDDGAVVYLNGTEVYRSNMPEGAIAYDTFAAGTTAGGAEDEFFEAAIDASLLQAGVNVVAVEVHQTSATSSDVSFDLELTQPLPVPGPGDPLVAAGATWRYLDDGSDQGTAWRGVGFDDGAWAPGGAQFGYGEGDETTVVDYGPDSGAKYETTYFRTSFVLSDPSVYTALKLKLVRDDGAVVYLNGSEVFRSNMASGPVGYRTLASAEGSNDYLETSVNAGLLRTGLNVVAVEVHLADGANAALSFALELLEGEATPIVDPTTFQADAVTYDIVYVRQPRYGDNTNTVWPEVFRPGEIDPGADLVLLKPDGTEEVLVTGGNGAVTDPFITFDGRYVLYSYFPDVRPEALNPDRDNLPKLGADIYRIDLETKEIERLTFQEFTPNTGAGTWDESNPVDPTGDVNRLGYGILNLGPCPLPGGKIAFTSNRNGFEPTRPYTNPTLQLYVMDEDGTNVTPIAPMTIGSALHPTILRDGRFLFSTYESQGLRDPRLWGIWSIWPDGRMWEPVVSAFREAQAFHFMTQLSDGDIVFADYYNEHNNGFGQLHRIPARPPAGTPAFRSAFRADNPYIDQTSEDNGALDGFKMPFTPFGMDTITPFTYAGDKAAPLGPDGVTRVGKVTHPSAAPGNDLLLVWTPGPANNLDRPTPVPYYDAGIYLVVGANKLASAADLVLIKNDPNYNEAWPRAVVSYRDVHGVDEPAELDWLPNDGTVREELPEGTPFGLVGTSSLYKRESFPGFGDPERYDGLDAFNNDFDRKRNWFVQGADAGKYTNAEIWAVRILAMEPNTHRSYGPDAGEQYFNHANERLRILGEIPVRKFQADGSPVLDSENNPDTSFLAKIPADTPFTFQTIDKDGMVLNMAQTWHQVRPGEMRANCGGCHAHSQLPLAFEGTAASLADYVVRDLSKETPLLTASGTRDAASGVVDVEFKRDVRPILTRACVSCHTKDDPDPPGNLVLDDLTEVDGLPGDYVRLAHDEAGAYGHPPIGIDREWEFPNASRYIRKFQSRRSLLVWKILGRRTDGWTNEDHPTETVPGDVTTLPAGANADDADLDYTGTIMPPPDSGVTALTSEEKLTIVRWIDLGCPIDLGPKGWFLDDLRPTLSVSSPRAENNPGPIDVIRIGVADANSGIKAGSLSIKLDFAVEGRAALAELADLASEVSDGVYEIALTEALTDVAEAHLYAEVSDVQGNITRVDVRFSVGN